MRKIRIGTRGSKLALIQAHYIASKLEQLGFESVIKVIKTTGDAFLDAPLYTIGGKGLFTKEIELSLKKREIDIAVHSLKDVPVLLDDELPLCAITQREDVRDVLISREGFESLPKGARVGTTSLRRSMQLKMLRDDLDTQSLRGNVQTRLARLESGDFDAIILARAALNRLELVMNGYVAHIFEIDEMIPAMGQGALGIQIRADYELREALSSLNHPHSARMCKVERDFVRELNGSCSMPLGVHARLVGEGESVELLAIYGEEREGRFVNIKRASLRSDSPEIASMLARDFS